MRKQKASPKTPGGRAAWTREQATFHRAQGLRLYEERMAKDLSQEEVAERAGICIQTVWTIENGKRDPGVWTIVRIARAIGVPPARLFP